VQQRLPSLLERPIAFAHRGAKAHARENTIEAFVLALRLGATGLESDVWLTADGVPVLDHDGVVRTGLRRRKLSTFGRDDLPSHIPTLADLIVACGSDFELSLDLQTRDVGPVVIDTIEQLAPELLPRLWLCHWDLDVLRSLRALDDTVRLVNSTKLRRMSEGPERRAATLADTEWSGGLTTLFHRFERLAFAWDLQFEHVLRNVIRMGIDGVFSDHVDVMTDALKAELDAS
jgi:glycerophosphoryl diester phosphodiesterase